MATSLDQAIALHQKHMDNPATATPASQQKLMSLLQQCKQEIASEERAEGPEETMGGGYGPKMHRQTGP